MDGRHLVAVLALFVALASFALVVQADDSDAATEDHLMTIKYAGMTEDQVNKVHISEGCYRVWASSGLSYNLVNAGSHESFVLSFFQSTMTLPEGNYYIASDSYRGYMDPDTLTLTLDRLDADLVYAKADNSDEMGLTYDTFPIGVGSYTFTSYLGFGFETYLVVNGNEIRCSGTIYVSDVDDHAHFRIHRNVESQRDTLLAYSLDLVESRSFDHVGVRCGSWSNPSCTYIYLKAGTYEMVVSDQASLQGQDYYYQSLTPYKVTPIKIDHDGSYYFQSSSGNSVIAYSISPEPVVDHIPDGAQMIHVDSGTVAKWMVVKWITPISGEGRFELSSSLGCYQFVKGSADEERFLRDIVEQKKSSFDREEYGSPVQFTAVSSASYDVYVLLNGQDPVYDGKVYLAFVDGSYNYNSRQCEVEYLAEDDRSYSFYVNANSNVRVGVRYDDSRYSLALTDGNHTVNLVNGVLFTLGDTTATEYRIIVTAYSSAENLFEAEYELYTQGEASPDNLGPSFAIVCVVICAVFFTLLGLAGRKPRLD